MNLSDDEIKLLIVSYLTGTIVRDDFIRLQQWINASPENRKLFNDLKDSWTLSGKKPMPVSKLNNSWIDFKERMELAEMQEANKTGKKINIINYLRIAATWLVFLALGSALTYLFTRNTAEMANNPVSVVVPLGAKSNITLPDGSSVWLNAGTTLTYYQDYGKKDRRLQLTGEAYFDVAKDKSHPFIVQTSGMVVRALGTRFNVKAYPDEKTISATLEEGSIDVRVIKAGKEEQQVMLRPKEKVVFFKEIRSSEVYNENTDEIVIDELSTKGIQPIEKKDINILTNVKTELYTSWKDPRWIIQAEQLGTLATSLERRYNLKIVFEDPDLKKYKFSGTIENETVDQIMDALRMTAPLDYSISKDIVTLSLDAGSKDEFGRIMTRK